ncbi:hypothetical protein FXO37_06952 [Capsicum annuum]|nr:hypothetical protein FXO37_06952 [Capsicum annuum]
MVSRGVEIGQRSIGENGEVIRLDVTQLLLTLDIKLWRAQIRVKGCCKISSKQQRTVENFVKEIQVMVYKAEGLIDKLTVEAKLHQEKNKLMQIMDIEYHKTVGDLTVDIRTALEQVKKIRKDNPQAFQAKPILDYHPEVVASGTQDTLLEENEVASFEEEAKIVIKRLAKGTSDLDVIPVVGFPGLGKTTLAKKISKDPQISFEFFLTIWVNVGPQYKLKGIFLKILKALKKQTTEYEP